MASLRAVFMLGALVAAGAVPLEQQEGLASALASDEECRARAGEPGCALNAIQLRGKKVSAAEATETAGVPQQPAAAAPPTKPAALTQEEAFEQESAADEAAAEEASAEEEATEEEATEEEATEEEATEAEATDEEDLEKMVAEEEATEDEASEEEATEDEATENYFQDQAADEKSTEEARWVKTCYTRRGAEIASYSQKCCGRKGYQVKCYEHQHCGGSSTWPQCKGAGGHSGHGGNHRNQKMCHGRFGPIYGQRNSKCCGPKGQQVICRHSQYCAKNWMGSVHCGGY